MHDCAQPAGGQGAVPHLVHREPPCAEPSKQAGFRERNAGIDVGRDFALLASPRRRELVQEKIPGADIRLHQEGAVHKNGAVVILVERCREPPQRRARPVQPHAVAVRDENGPSPSRPAVSAAATAPPVSSKSASGRTMVAGGPWRAARCAAI